MKVELPENPTREMLLIFNDIIDRERLSFEKLVEIAKLEQRKLGLSVVPPRFEMEHAAAHYRLLYNHLKRIQNEN